jgi:hypothetical protein
MVILPKRDEQKSRQRDIGTYCEPPVKLVAGDGRGVEVGLDGGGASPSCDDTFSNWALSSGDRIQNVGQQKVCMSHGRKRRYLARGEKGTHMGQLRFIGHRKGAM